LFRSSFTTFFSAFLFFIFVFLIIYFSWPMFDVDINYRNPVKNGRNGKKRV